MEEMARFPLRRSDVVPGMIECLEQTETFVRLRKFDARTQRDLQAVIDDCIFNIIRGKTGVMKRPGAANDLRSMFCLCQHFINRPSTDTRQQYSVFETIFLGRENEVEVHALRIEALAKVVSLAICVNCNALLANTAFWLQKISLNKGQSLTVRAFCAKVAVSFTETSDRCFDWALHLMDMCPTLAMTMLPFMVDEYDYNVLPPLFLLQLFATWLHQQPKAFFLPFRDIGISKLSPTAPIYKVTNQCLEKLINICVTQSISTTDSVDENVGLTVSKLRLALLSVLQTVPRSSNDEACCTVSGKRAADMLLQIAEYKRCTESFDAKLSSSMDAFSELMVTAVINRVFSGTKRDFNFKVCQQLSYGHPLLGAFFSMLN